MESVEEFTTGHRQTIAAARLYAIRYRLGFALVLGWAMLILPGCGSLDTEPALEVPSLFDELADADLSPAPRRSRNANRLPATDRPGEPYQLYPGDDEVIQNNAATNNQAALKPSGPGVTASGDLYEVNFSNTALPALTKVILTDTLNVPHVYDNRVQGQVTLSTGRPVSRDELLASLESILQMNRGTLIKEGERYRVVPTSEVKSGGAGEFSYADEAAQIGPGYGVTIFPLRYVSSETMRQLLSAYVAKIGALRADIRNNLLLVRGTGQERRDVMQFAMQLDVDWMKGQSVGIYALTHVTPDQIIPELEQIFQTSTGGLGNNVVRFQSMAWLGSVLVLTSRSAMLKKVEAWVRRLDRVNNTTVRTFVYHVENGQARDMAKVLNEVFVGTQGTSEEVTPDQVAAEITEPADQNLDEELETETVQTTQNQTTATENLRDLSPSLSEQVRIVSDDVKNNLIIRASGRTYEKVLAVLKDLDNAPAQVVINATLAEVTLNDTLRYGVQIFLKERGLSSALGFTNAESLAIVPNLPGLTFLAGLKTTPKVVLDALANETSVRVVSSPTVVVLDNQPATLQVGDVVPIVTRQAQSVTDPDAPIVNNIEHRDTGVILTVTPHISSSGLVTMEIEQEISNVVSTTAVGDAGNLTPTIARRRIASTISVQSEQMVVLGGLISERKDHFKNRVPIWEKIPIIGNIPGKTDNTSVRTELVIFLRPQVIRSSAEASRIAEELRARLRSLNPNQKTKYKGFSD